MTYKKDDCVTVTITDCGNEGEGIGKIDGYPFFIKDTVIGDEVRAKVMKAKKNYAYARRVELIKKSELRTEPRCPVSKSCGGCQIQAMSYEAQLSYKENKVRNNLMRIGGISEAVLTEVMEPIIGMEDSWRYRNKAQYPIGRAKTGELVAGFYAGRTHSIIACEDCSLSPEVYGQILHVVLNYMEINEIEPYDEVQHTGIVRHVLIREGFATDEIMVCLVVNTDIGKVDGVTYSLKQTFPNLNDFVDELNKIPGIRSIVLNENRQQTNVILGTKCITLSGNPAIEDELCDLRFRISPLAFYQVNPVQAEKLYATALEFADLNGTEEVWDICCGIGTITLALSKQAKFVHGLEIVPEAIEDAKINAELNQIENVEFITAAAEEYLPAHKADITADVIVVDPPRKGMDEAALEVMTLVSPSKIVYVSCDSATLARDVKYLMAAGYEVKRVRTCDMFPHSAHVETVVLMSRRE